MIARASPRATHGQAVEFSLTENDFADVSVFVFMRSMMRWKVPWMRRIALLLLPLFFVVSLYRRWEENRPLASTDDIGVVLAVIFLIALPHAPRWIARRQFRSKAYAPVRAPRRIEISAEGVRTEDGTARALTRWGSILEIVQTEAAAYLFILRAPAYVVPRHAFADEVAFEAFVAAARAWWRPNG